VGECELTFCVEECDDFNAPGPVAFQTFCGLGNSRRKARGALAPALV